jgi:RsiW-degrading membrane proteinase PrsW (M82 family)
VTRLGGRQAWALLGGLIAVTFAVAFLDAGELFAVERSWILSHPVQGVVQTGDIRDTAHEAALVGFSLLFALVAAIPTFAMVAWLTRRAGRRAAEALLAAALAALLIAIQFGRIQSFLAAQLAISWSDLRPVILTPPVEEAVKLVAAATVLSLGLPRGARPAIVLGLAAGIGFNVFEAGLYVMKSSLAGAGHEGQWTTIWSRFALLGFGLHAVTAALSTAGLALSLDRARGGLGRALPAFVGFGSAMLIHGLWNATTGWIYSIVMPVFRPDPDAQVDPLTGLIVGSITVLPYLVVPIAALVAIWRRHPNDMPAEAAIAAAPVPDTEPSPPLSSAGATSSD